MLNVLIFVVKNIVLRVFMLIFATLYSIIFYSHLRFVKIAVIWLFSGKACVRGFRLLFHTCTLLREYGVMVAQENLGLFSVVRVHLLLQIRIQKMIEYEI